MHSLDCSNPEYEKAFDRYVRYGDLSMVDSFVEFDMYGYPLPESWREKFFSIVGMIDRSDMCIRPFDDSEKRVVLRDTQNFYNLFKHDDTRYIMNCFNENRNFQPFIKKGGFSLTEKLQENNSRIVLPRNKKGFDLLTNIRMSKKYVDQYNFVETNTTDIQSKFYIRSKQKTRLWPQLLIDHYSIRPHKKVQLSVAVETETFTLHEFDFDAYVPELCQFFGIERNP